MKDFKIGQSVRKLGEDYTTGRIGQVQGLILSENRIQVLWLKDADGKSIHLVTKCVSDFLEPIDHVFKDEDFMIDEDERGCDRFYRIKGFTRYELGSNRVIYNVKSKKPVKAYPSGAEGVLFVFMINDKGVQEKVNFQEIVETVFPKPQPRKKPKNTLLTMEQAREIRKFKAEKRFTDKKLAEMFGVSKQNIYHIVKHHIYKEG